MRTAGPHTPFNGQTLHAPRTRPWVRQMSYKCISMPDVCWVLVPLWGCGWLKGEQERALRAETSDLAS